MIEIENLTKRQGEKRAVDGLDFVARPGIVTGFPNPNGIGGSTTLRMIAGLGPTPQVRAMKVAQVPEGAMTR